MKRMLLLVLMLLVCLVTNVKAENTSTIIFAPHPDDEVLMTGGFIGQKTSLQKNDLKVVVLTNGDVMGTTSGKTRIGETLNGLSVLGLGKSNIYFFGYGDQTLSKIASLESPNDPFTSPYTGMSNTYGNPEKGVTDYHSSIFGQPGNYNRATILTDLKHILSTNKSADIYVPCAYDANTDHWAAYRLIIEALIEMKKQNPSYCPNIFQYLIHAPGGNKVWPEGQGENDFSKEFTIPSTNTVPPVSFTNLLQLKNESIVKYPVSVEMRSTKYEAIMQYKSQIGKDDKSKAYLTSFVKGNEFFWKNTLNNLAFNATVTVSSENKNTRQLGIKAIDGIIDGAKSDAVTDELIREWVTQGKTTASIRLSWLQPQTMNRIVLYDRPNPDDCIQKATLTFSDGSKINIDKPLRDDGSGDVINFPEKNSVWVQLDITQAKGNNTGLAEFEVYATK